jgi:hypothetical protein
MSKFILKRLVQISKALVNSKIQFLIQKSFFLFTSRFRPSWPYRPTCPLAQLAPPASLPRRPKPSSPAHLAHVSMASLHKCVFLFGLRLPSWSCSLSVKWTLPISPFFSPGHATTSIRCSQPSPSPRSAPRDAASVP